MFRKGLEQLCRLSRSGLLMTGLSKTERSFDEGDIELEKLLSVLCC
jgi:hypothetical protein